MSSRAAFRSIPQPPERLSKKICFILNNLTERNLKNQTHELMSQLPLHFNRWLAEFIISRVATESNLVDMYTEFVLLATNRQNNFRPLILDLLTREIDFLLRPGQLNPNNGRSLKNFGAFLGRLTLAKGIKLGVDLKSLIYVAYKNRPESLDYIVPFICELLKNIKHSGSFRQLDPWVQEILEVAKELHNITDKLPIQFEVELLFSYLECDMRDITTAFYLRRIK
ncbi:CCR4-NOT transcription complex subunit 1 [Taenia crassiceps]|uniref:CCR4-NOT transcription complex subunit 1 n=1 Tax=Taenia crassiceps TaxID=6207 RepID=A0ABR4QPS4_9CEST